MSEPSTDTLVRPDTNLLEGEDREKFAHYAKKAEILKAQIEGIPCKALCGKLWIPTRDPEKFPVCPECQEIYDGMRSW